MSSPSSLLVSPSIPNDLLDLGNLTEDRLVRTLQSKYSSDDIYSMIGDVLIVVNPFKQVESEDDTKSLLNRYSQCNSKQELMRHPPHNYSIAKLALLQMIENKQSQSIVISGESGAGKTESTKLILRVLTHDSHHNGGDTTQSSNTTGSSSSSSTLLMSSNPILEAFGNAKTLRNNNSSRFGKFLKMNFISDNNHNQSRLESSTIHKYLLEKSRVVYALKNERLYHVFYYLVKGLNNNNNNNEHKFLKDLQSLNNGKTCEDYCYLKQTQCYDVTTVDDISEFQLLISSMKTLTFSEDEIKQIFSLILGMLFIGNIKYDQSSDNEGYVKIDYNSSDSKQGFDQCHKLWGFQTNKNESSKLEKCLVKQIRLIRGTETSSPLDESSANNQRDSLCKTIYDRLFEYIVNKINRALQSTNNENDKTKKQRSSKHKSSSSSSSPSSLFIGVLDIFGFENFIQSNSFEQLCINFCNEKLQSLFNDYAWSRELQVYQSEGISTQFILDDQSEQTAKMNTLCCEMFEDSKSGLIRLIKDEITMPKSNDHTLLIKFNKSHSKKRQNNKHNSDSMNNNQLLLFQADLDHQTFIIKHFASEVEYNIPGFLDKNKENLSQYQLNVLNSSNLPLLKQLFNKDANDSKSVAKGKSCVATSFHKDLKNLVRNIKETESQFTRCVKPNDEKQPLLFDRDKVSDQLRCSGIIAYLALRQAGYDVQIPYEECVQTMLFSISKEKNENNRDSEIVMKSWMDLQNQTKDAKSIVLDLIPLLNKEYMIKDDPQKKSILMGNGKLFTKSKLWSMIQFRHGHSIKVIQSKFRLCLENGRKQTKEEEEKVEVEEEEELEEKDQSEQLTMIKEEKEKESTKEQSTLIDNIEQEKHAINKEIDQINEEIHKLEESWEQKKSKMRNEMIQRLKDDTIDERVIHGGKAHVKIQEELDDLKHVMTSLISQQNTLKEQVTLQEQRTHQLKNKVSKLKKIRETQKKKQESSLDNIADIPPDTWQIRSIGTVTQTGGTSLWSQLSNDSGSFIGLLRKGDTVALLSLKGFSGNAENGRICARIRVVHCQSGKFTSHFGFVPLTDLSFYH